MQQRTRDDTHPQSQYCGTAPYSLRSRQRQQCTPKTRTTHCAMTQPRFFTFSQAQRAPRADQRRDNHARTDTHDATSPIHHNTTSASRRVSPKTAHAYKPRNAHRTLACRIQTHKPRTPARRPAQPQPLRSAHTSLHAHRRTHATHSTAHSSALATHRPQKITPSHTRRLCATLTTVQSGCPASTECCRRVDCCSTPTPCRTHAQPSRRTMAPDAAADPSEPPATHLSASHSINQIKLNDKPVSTLHAIARAQHRARVFPNTTQPDSPQVPDTVIPHNKPATLRRSRTSQRDTQRYHARANKRSANNNNTATANSE